MFGLGIGEILVILIVALLVFGPEKLPELARTLGKTTAELKRSLDEIKFEINSPKQEIQKQFKEIKQELNQVLTEEPKVAEEKSEEIATEIPKTKAPRKRKTITPKTPEV